MQNWNMFSRVASVVDRIIREVVLRTESGLLYSFDMTMTDWRVCAELTITDSKDVSIFCRPVVVRVVCYSTSELGPYIYVDVFDRAGCKLVSELASTGREEWASDEVITRTVRCTLKAIGNTTAGTTSPWRGKPRKLKIWQTAVIFGGQMPKKLVEPESYLAGLICAIESEYADLVERIPEVGIRRCALHVSSLTRVVLEIPMRDGEPGGITLEKNISDSDVVPPWRVLCYRYSDHDPSKTVVDFDVRLRNYKDVVSRVEDALSSSLVY